MQDALACHPVGGSASPTSTEIKKSVETKNGAGFRASPVQPLTGNDTCRFTTRMMPDVTASHISTEIRVAVLGGWVPSQLADVLALQRAEEPETTAVLVEGVSPEQIYAASNRGFDFAVSTTEARWPGWVCDPLWYDTLAVAIAKRSHLLGYSKVPRLELLKQPFLYVESTANEPWRATADPLFMDFRQDHEQTVNTFDVAMTLVAAGYGITLAPAARLAGYQCRGIALRPLADTPPIVLAYLLHPCTALTKHQERFARRIVSVS